VPDCCAIRAAARARWALCLWAALAPAAPAADVEVAPWCRVRNDGGNCVYCAFETLARHHGLRRWYGLAAAHRGEGVRGHGGCLAVLRASGLRYAAARGRDDTRFLARHVMLRRYGVVAAGHGHALVVVEWGPYRVGVIDNLGGPETRYWTREEFLGWWDGRAYALIPPGGLP
jgi:hypothetical protein